MADNNASLSQIVYYFTVSKYWDTKKLTDKTACFYLHVVLIWRKLDHINYTIKNMLGFIRRKWAEARVLKQDMPGNNKGLFVNES